MAKVGDYAVISQVPIVLYYSSDRAAVRNYSGSGYVQKTGNYEIINIAWTDSTGNWYYPSKGAGTIELYGINDITNSFEIGWVRSDDLAVPTTINRIHDFVLNTTTDIGVYLNINMQNINNKIEILVGGTVFKTLSTVRASLHLFRFTQSDLNAIYASVPNLTSGSITFRVTTISSSNGAQIGQPQNHSETFAVPVDIKPSINHVSVIYHGAIDGKLYQNISSTRIAVEAVAGSGATISNSTIRVGTMVGLGLNYTSGVLTTSGDVDITVTVTDSRGRTAVHNSIVNVVAYSGVQMTAFNANRVLDDNGMTEYVLVSSMGSAGYVTDNKISGSFSYRKRTDTNWISAGTVEIATISGMFAHTYQVTGFQDTASYDLRVVLTDGIGQTHTFMTTVGTANYPMMWGKHGASFGRTFNNDLPQNLQVGSGGILIGDTVITEAQIIALKQLL